MTRRKLTSRTLETLRPAPAGKRYDVMDSDTPGLGVRVNDKGRWTYIFAARFPGKANYTRREIDDAVGADALAKAREEARRWTELIRRGIDPAHEKRRRLQEQEIKRKNTFKAVFEDFRDEKLAAERKRVEVAQTIEKEFVSAWGDLPIADISEDDVRALIKAKKAKAPAQARNMLGYARRMFSWAIDERVYGIKSNPCREIRARKLLPTKNPRERILTDDELIALHRAAKRLPYPHGQVYLLLLLSALRLNEAADARWSEFHSAVVAALRARKNGEAVNWSQIPSDRLIWVIPAGRMKGTNEKAREHVVPLTSDILALLESLPQFGKGDHLFTTSFGEKPVWMTSKVKERLDRRMLRTLRALARARGEDPAKVELKPWVNHDIRRSIRSGLSALRIDRDIREAVLAHKKPGIEGVYDRHDYLEEKKDALERWAGRLRGLSAPVLANVVPLRVSAEA